MASSSVGRAGLGQCGARHAHHLLLVGLLEHDARLDRQDATPCSPLRADAAPSAPPRRSRRRAAAPSPAFREDAGQALDLAAAAAGIAITIGGSARRRIARAVGRSFATSSISGWPT